MLTFGPRAARWAAALPADLPVIAVDETGVREAYLAAVERRSNAEPFFLWPCIPHARAHTARAISRTIHGGRAYHEQRALFAQLADGTLIVDGVAAAAMGFAAVNDAAEPIADLLRLADGLFVPSRREADRLIAAHGPKASVAVAAWPDPGVPRVARHRAHPSIVVWAKGTPFDENFVLVHALEEMRLPVAIVAGDGDVFARPESGFSQDAAEVLAGASAIVDASPFEPSAALALAAIGAPMAVAETSGADEYLDGAFVYTPWDWLSIYAAVSRALGGSPPRLRDLGAREVDARATIAAACAPPPVDGPRVTVVIPTYNRRERLAAALAAMARQLHRDVEVIVVNDAGEPVDDIVAAFPGVRSIVLERNGGPERAINAGFAAATGAYVTLIPDDDAFYPDHLARMVDACERSGCAIAHGNTIIRFEREVDGALALEGFAANVFRFALEKTMSLSSSPVAGHSFVVRRDVGERLGWFDDSLPVLGDQEIQTRFAAAFDFAHVDRVTVEWRFTGGASNLSSRKAALVPEAMRAWFDRHPSSRPDVERMRATFLEAVDRREPGWRFTPVVRYAE